jgi:uncharacterized phage-like protein YoqJ
MGKSCCVTGHRDIPAVQTVYVKEELRRQIQLAVADGYTHFISGMAEGADLYFAAIVAEMKAANPNITLEAAVPYRKRLEAKNKDFQRLIKLCDSVHVTAETYAKSVYINRNMYMVGKSERVIAVYDGRGDGGTAFTIRYAGARGREVIIIPAEPK